MSSVVPKYLLVNVEDVNAYTWMEPAATCTAAVTAETLLPLCAVMGVPRRWVSDTARHFKNRALRLVADALGTWHRFAVANSPWIDRTVKRMMRGIMSTFQAIVNRNHRPLAEWMQPVPVVK